MAARSVPLDLNALVGEHWLKQEYLLRPLNPAEPAYLMFYPLSGRSDTLTLVGVAFGVGQDAGSPMPQGLAGAADRWHLHFSCSGVPGLGSTLAHDAEDCRTLGGQPGVSQVAMVHVWLIPNPDGPFADFNPALPYLATGLTPPTTDEMATAERSRRARTLALAVAESYRGTPRLGSRIDPRPGSPFAQRVAPQRERIRVLIDALREAERLANRRRYDRTADSVIAQWRVIRQAYLDAADSPALRKLIARWYEIAIDPARLHARETGH